MGIPYAYRHPVRVYAYGISHTRMGKIRILDRTFIKDLSSTWRRHANQLRIRIEWIPESDGNQVQETPQETAQPSTPPLRRSTRVRRPRQPWSPSNT